MKKITLISLLMISIQCLAQKPKLYIKLLGGMNTTSLVYKQENTSSDFLVGWQAGASSRLQYRKMFGEFGFIYFEQGFTLAANENSDLPLDTEIDVTFKGFEIPFTAGYIPYRNPLFGVYVYGGFVNWFYTKGQFTYENQKIHFKPKEANLHFYNIAARIGAQIDFAMLNFDINYSMGMTNAIRSKVRTNSHTINLSVGILF